MVCSYYCYRNCGAETLRRFITFARSKRYKALRIYATSGSQGVWKDKWGFQERETVVNRRGRCEHGPLQRLYHPEDPHSVRMTLIL